MKKPKLQSKIDFILYSVAIKNERGDMDVNSIKQAMLILANDAFKAGRKGRRYPVPTRHLKYSTFTSYKNSITKP